MIYEIENGQYFISCADTWWRWEQDPPHWCNTNVDSKIWVPSSRTVSRLQFLIKTGWDFDNTMKAIIPHD